MEKRTHLEEEEIPKPDYDTRWKEVIERFAPEFIQYFYSKTLWLDVDKSREIKPMSDELQKMFPDFKKKGRLYPDKLIKMFLNTGEEHFVIVHTEVERSPSQDVKKRTYQCFVRLQEKNPDAIITSLVIFIGRSIPKKCNVYTYKKYETELTYKYKVCKVRDLNEQKLLKSKNPIALVMLAAYYNIKTEGRKNLDKRLQFKLKLAKLCFDKGYDKQFILDLFWFIGFTIALPISKESEYRKKIHSFLKQKKENMPLIDEYPAPTIEVIELVMYGKTLEERDAEVTAKVTTKSILGFFALGLDPVKIAQGLSLDLKYVEEVIANHTQKN